MFFLLLWTCGGRWGGGLRFGHHSIALHTSTSSFFSSLRRFARRRLPLPRAPFGMFCRRSWLWGPRRSPAARWTSSVASLDCGGRHDRRSRSLGDPLFIQARYGCCHLRKCWAGEPATISIEGSYLGTQSCFRRGQCLCFLWNQCLLGS